MIATARKDFDPAAFDPSADLLPLVTGLELLALVGIVDPPRPAARASIATAKKAGIRVRMITGDYAVTAATVAGQLAIARTMGMVILALLLLFFSIESKDDRDSAFSLGTFSAKTFVITTSGSFVLLILSTVLSIFHTVMKTVTLDVVQWLICTAVALSVVVAAEIRKALLRRRAAAKAVQPAGAPRAGATTP